MRRYGNKTHRETVTVKMNCQSPEKSDLSDVRFIRGPNTGKTWGQVLEEEQRVKYDYLDIDPIASSIPPKKQEAKRHYGVHPYFTRRSWNVVQAYIERFTQIDDLVVDPFGGSGVTAVEALVLRRRTVHIDINPLANFIAKCVAVSPVDLKALQREFDHVMKQCQPLADKLDKLTEEQAAELPIHDWYPKDVRLPKNADCQFVHELFSPKQLRLLAKIRTSILKTEDELLKELLLYVFSATITKCNLLLISAKGRNPSRGGATPTQLYRYYLPKNPPILNPIGQFSDKFKKFILMKAETNDVIGEQYSAKNCRIFKGDAGDLQPFLKNESADYVYTDPPYGANIAYLDLSTMWNAWLGFEVTEEDKRAEVIENGDLDRSKEDYVKMLKQSIYEVFRVLKWNRWFSLVYAHKDPLFWDTIIKTAQTCGFQYVNTSTVKAGIVSYHKHKNPLHVLSGELVINFQKKRNPIAIAVSKVGAEAVNVVLNSAEVSIAGRVGGATTDEIHEDLIPKLIESGLLSELRDKITDITPLIGDKFEYNQITKRWYVPPNTKLGSYLPVDVRIRFYVESFLNNCERRDVKATLDMIWADLMPNLKNGRQPTHQTILKEISRIAEPYNDIYWRLQKERQEEIFAAAEVSGLKRVASGLPQWNATDEEEVHHNEAIFYLSHLGEAVGLQPYIGLQERSRGDYARQLAELSLSTLPKGLKLNAYGKKKVEQIDLIWFDKAGFPAYAFEIEMSTSITSGIERFIELLKGGITIAGKVILVCPESRKTKLDDVLSNSTFIGAPMYMENKLKYLYVSDVVQLYQNFSHIEPSLEALAVDLRKRLHTPDLKKS